MSQINSLPREWRGDSATPEIEAQRARVGDAEEGGGAGFQLDYTWQGGSRDQDHHCQVRRVGTVPITGKVPYSCNNQCKKINVIQMRTGGVVTVTLRTGTGYVLEIKKKRERFMRKLVPGYRYTVPEKVAVSMPSRLSRKREQASVPTPF